MSVHLSEHDFIFSEVIVHYCILAVNMDVELYICNWCLFLECAWPFFKVDEGGSVACKGVLV
jgi:hypothetical protein